jgi:hypothetical protein
MNQPNRPLRDCVGQGAAKAPETRVPGRPRTFRLAGGKVVVEPKRFGGLEGLAELLPEALHVVEGELGARAQDAA